MQAEKLKDDPRFKFGPPPIQTAEDAVQQFLRGQIDEQEMKDACALYGRDPADVLGVPVVRPDRIDLAFENRLPEDVMNRTVPVEYSYEHNKERVDAKEEIREEATKAAEKDKTVEETQKREGNADWVHKVEEKYLTKVSAPPKVHALRTSPHRTSGKTTRASKTAPRKTTAAKKTTTSNTTTKK